MVWATGKFTSFCIAAILWNIAVQGEVSDACKDSLVDSDVVDSNPSFASHPTEQPDGTKWTYAELGLQAVPYLNLMEKLYTIARGLVYVTCAAFQLYVGRAIVIRAAAAPAPAPAVPTETPDFDINTHFSEEYGIPLADVHRLKNAFDGHSSEGVVNGRQLSNICSEIGIPLGDRTVMNSSLAFADVLDWAMKNIDWEVRQLQREYSVGDLVLVKRRSGHWSAGRVAKVKERAYEVEFERNLFKEVGFNQAPTVLLPDTEVTAD